MMSFSFYLLALMPLSYAFSLDTQTEFWNYTSSSLADTTSSKCKKAYSAQIDCDPLLADLVAASEERYMLPDYDMDMFFDMCTATCHDSVKDYINNVQESCSYPEDAALAVEEGTSLSFVDPEFITVPVETIANLFLYTLMRSCAKEYVNFHTDPLPGDADAEKLIAMDAGMERTATSPSLQCLSPTMRVSGTALPHGIGTGIHILTTTGTSAWATASGSTMGPYSILGTTSWSKTGSIEMIGVGRTL